MFQKGNFNWKRVLVDSYRASLVSKKAPQEKPVSTEDSTPFDYPT
jgi:hypothetical protein